MKKRCYMPIIAALISVFAIQVSAGSPLEQEVFSESGFACTYDGARLVYNSSMYGYERKGYLMTDNIDAEHGESLKIGMPDTPKQGETSSPYVVINQKSNTNLRIVFSVYLSGKTDYRMAVYRAAEGTSGSREINLMRWQDKLDISGAGFDFEKERWYSAELNIDFVTGEYSVAIDNEIIAEHCKLGVNSADSIRFYGHTKAADAGFMAIDDVAMYVKSPAPEISSIGCDGAHDGAVTASCSTLEFYLNTPMYRITDEQVHLYINNVQTRFNRMGYDSENGVIVLDVNGLLTENAQCRIIIDENAEIFKDTPLGEVISKEFSTQMSGVALTEAVFEQSGEMVSIDAVYVNNTGEAQGVFAAAAVWEGDEFIGLESCDEILDEGESRRSYSIVGLKKGQRIELYVWDSLWGGEYLANRLYTYEVE